MLRRDEHVGGGERQRVKVVENGRTVVHQQLALGIVAIGVPVVVPGRDPGAGMLQDHHRREALGPVIQVHLIAHLAVFVAVVAPLQAPLAPPVQHLEAEGVTAKTEQADVVLAARRLQVGDRRRVAVLVDEDRGGAKLIEDGLGRGEEVQVGVQVGQELDLGEPFEHAQDDRRGGGPVVLDVGAGGLGREQALVAFLDGAEGHHPHPGEAQAVQEGLGLLVQAHGEEGEPVGVGLRDELDQGDRPDQVVAIEVAAVVAVHGASNAASSQAPRRPDRPARR
ncbi:hypothetical protein D3C86_1464650 [compost metagenome]